MVFLFLLLMLLIVSTTCSSKSSIETYNEQHYISSIASRFQSSDILEITIPSITLLKLADSFDKSDHSHIKLFIIRTTQEVNSQMFDILDHFRGPRLDLILKRIGISNNNLEFIVFERIVHPVLKEALQILSRNNYMSQAECDSNPIKIVNVMEGSWGNTAYQMGLWIQSTYQYVHYLYGRFGSNDKFLKKECNELNSRYQNKYECVFLSSTNCTIPTLFANPEQRKALPESDVLTFQKASTDGEFIKNNEYDTKSSKLEDYTQKLKNNDYARVIYNINHSLHHRRINKAADIVHDNVKLHVGVYGIDQIFVAILQFGYVKRYNTRFTIRVQNIVDKFRINSGLSTNMSCTMIHVRKDDRSVRGVDMIEWCRNSTIVKNGGYERKPTVDSTTYADYGCDLVLPYGAVSMEHYVNASLTANPKVHNLYFVTDDEEWLFNAVRDYKLKHPHSHSRSGKRSHHRHNDLDKGVGAGASASASIEESGIVKGTHHKQSSHHHHRIRLFPFESSETAKHRFNTTLDSFAEMFASIEVGQQCSALVGHMSSAMTKNIFDVSLCYHSQKQYLHCPACFDMAGQGVRLAKES